MRGDTHRAGALALNEVTKLPLSIFYLIITKSIAETLIVYFLYDYITIRPTLIGAVLPDYDQTRWRYTPNELPNKMGYMFHKFLKFRKAKHRSTHTHNIDLWTIIFGIPSMLLYGTFINTKNGIYFMLGTWILSLYISILSHQFLDTLTVAGTNQSHLRTKILGEKDKKLSITPINKKFYQMSPIYFRGRKTWLFVPEVLKFEDSWGRTGGGWEEFIERRLIRFINNQQRARVRAVEVCLLYIVYKII